MKPNDRCFKCGIEFDQSYEGGDKDWPSLVFDSSGNWGSTIFDQNPFQKPTTWIRIRVCDKCVVDGKDLIQVTGDESLVSWELRKDVQEFFDGRCK